MGVVLGFGARIIMRSAKGRATRPSVVNALSRPGGRNVAKAVGALLNWTDAGRDHSLGQRSLALMRPAIRTLKTALPETDPELIGGVLANLLDLWETSRKLEQELQKLKKLRFPRDREVLRSILVWIDAIQVDMSLYWIGEVKRDLPKLLRALDRLERRAARGKAKHRLSSLRQEANLKRS